MSNERYILLSELCKFYNLSKEVVEKELGLSQYSSIESLIPGQNDIVKEILSSGRIGGRKGSRLAMLSVGLTAMGSKDTADSPIAQWSRNEIRKSMSSVEDRITLGQYQTLILKQDLRQCAFCGRNFASARENSRHVTQQHDEEKNNEQDRNQSSLSSPSTSLVSKTDYPGCIYCSDPDCAWTGLNEFALRVHLAMVHGEGEDRTKFEYKVKDAMANQARIRMLHASMQNVKNYFSNERAADEATETQGSEISWPNQRLVRGKQSQGDLRGLNFPGKKKPREEALEDLGHVEIVE